MSTGKPKINGSSKGRKVDTSEKVREIKQRQQNWLSQREQSKKQAPKSNQLSQMRSLSGKEHKIKDGSAQSQSQKTVPGNRNTLSIQDKFHSWRKSQVDTHDDENDNDCISVRSGAESELERLVSPEIESIREPVSEEKFDDLADQIAIRVKENLGLPYQSLSSHNSSSSAHLSEQYSNDPSLTLVHNKTSIHEMSSSDHMGTSSLTSHNCIVCKRLMLSSNHIPTMVIPCGHTMCKTCSEGCKMCPSCGCHIMSLTINIMLQQVIQEYHNHHEHTTALNSLSPETRFSSRCENVTEDKQRNWSSSYKSQLANLQTRHSVLTIELRSLKEDEQHTKEQLKHKSSQIDNIKVQEKDVTSAMEELQERLNSLMEHRKQYEKQISMLKVDKAEIDGKLTLLSGTLSSLTREIEKVNLLAEGED